MMSTREKANFSVIIPTFNAETFLEKSVASAQAQTLPVQEVVIVDDGSTDQTLAVARRLARADSRIRVFRQPENRGPAAARNRAIAESTGEWIALLDADDRFLPDRLAHLAGAIDRLGGEVDIVADQLQWVKRESITRPDFHISDLSFPLQIADFVDRARPYGAAPDLGLLKPVFRRRLFGEYGLSYRETQRHGEDFSLIIDAIIVGARYWIIPYSGYLITDRSVGTSRTKIDYARMREFDIARRDQPAFRNDPAALDALDRRIDALARLELEILPIRTKLLRGFYKQAYWDVVRRFASRGR